MNTRTLAILFVGIALTTTTQAGAESASLAAARQAYANVDYDATRRLARTALEQGGNDRDATADLYLLWATAAAALGHDQEARAAFTVALAVDPKLKLEKQLSPKIRAPYLEARGSLAAANGRAPLGLRAELREQRLELAMVDALGVAAHLEVAMRASDAASFSRRRLAPAPRHELRVGMGSPDLAAFARILDRYGNVLLDWGSELQPNRFIHPTSPSPKARASLLPRDESPAPYYVTAAALGALGLTAGSVAAVLHLRREDAANEWNGPGCERPGSSRGQQCRDVDERRQRAEDLAVGFTAAGGALLVGGLISLVLAPARRVPGVALHVSTTACSVNLATKL